MWYRKHISSSHICQCYKYTVFQWMLLQIKQRHKHLEYAGTIYCSLHLKTNFVTHTIITSCSSEDSHFFYYLTSRPHPKPNLSDPLWGLLSKVALTHLQRHAHSHTHSSVHRTFVLQKGLDVLWTHTHTQTAIAFNTWVYSVHAGNQVIRLSSAPCGFLMA